MFLIKNLANRSLIFFTVVLRLRLTRITVREAQPRLSMCQGAALAQLAQLA